MGGNRREKKLIALIVLFTMTTGLPAVQADDRVYRYSDGPANRRLGERVRDGFATTEMATGYPALPLRSPMAGPWAAPGRVEASPFFAGMGGTGIRLPVALSR